jgi:hypothetical protein
VAARNATFLDRSNEWRLTSILARHACKISEIALFFQNVALHIITFENFPK